MIRKLVVEAIGTFFLTLTVGLVILGGTASPLPVGAILIAMVYMGGHVSGAHYNPAVTLGVFLRGRATATELLSYVLTQLAAAGLAALAARQLAPEAEGLAFAVTVLPALLAELVFTFALVFVVLNVATARGTEGNSYFGAAIGLTVLAAAYTIGSVSGAAINPAVALLLVLLDLLTPRSMWVLLVGELLGGVLAAVVFNALDLGSDKSATTTVEEQVELTMQAEPEAS
jgi:aquaporin Z